MAEETIDNQRLTVSDGIRLGIGIFIVNMISFVVIGTVAWIIITLMGYFG
jgi:large-conductance mechanosensitive channel